MSCNVWNWIAGETSFTQTPSWSHNRLVLDLGVLCSNAHNMSGEQLAERLFSGAIGDQGKSVCHSIFGVFGLKRVPINRQGRNTRNSFKTRHTPRVNAANIHFWLLFAFQQLSITCLTLSESPLQRKRFIRIVKFLKRQRPCSAYALWHFDGFRSAQLQPHGSPESFTKQTGTPFGWLGWGQIVQTLASRSKQVHCNTHTHTHTYTQPPNKRWGPDSTSPKKRTRVTGGCIFLWTMLGRVCRMTKTETKWCVNSYKSFLQIISGDHLKKIVSGVSCENSQCSASRCSLVYKEEANDEIKSAPCTFWRLKIAQQAGCCSTNSQQSFLCIVVGLRELWVQCGLMTSSLTAGGKLSQLWQGSRGHELHNRIRLTLLLTSICMSCFVSTVLLKQCGKEE